MSHHVLRLDVVAGDNVFSKRDQRRNLRRCERRKMLHPGRFLPATVLELNAHRGIIDTVGAAPEADTRMPGQFAFRHQLPDARLTVRGRRCGRDQIVRADVFIRQRGQRAVKIIRGVVKNQHFYARIRRLGLMARIQLVGTFIDNPFFRDTSCQQQRQQEWSKRTPHRRVFTAVPLTLTISMLPSLPTVS